MFSNQIKNSKKTVAQGAEIRSGSSERASGARGAGTNSHALREGGKTLPPTRKLRRSGWFLKSICIWLVINFLTIFVFPPSLVAQPFRDFEGEDKKALESYLNRATNMQDLDQWRSYVQAGLISLKADWEEDAAQEIQDRQDRIREEDLDDDQEEAELDALDTEYETARIDWETEASQLILEREADFRVKQENIEGLEISEQEYQDIIATAEATFENNPELDLDGWESLVEGLNASLVEAFETDLEARIAEARDNIGPLDDTQIEALDQAIAEKEAEIRNEFEMREHFYLLKAKNRYIALKRADDLSAKVQNESGSAEEIGDQAIQDAETQVEEQTAALLEQSEEALNSEEGSPDPLEYQRQVEEIISQGLQVFEEAEEDLYQDRLVWMEATKTSRAEAEEIWKEEHEKLKSARDAWLQAVQTKIEEGRAKYAEKFQEFEENRAQAEADLQDYIDQERDRWNGSSEQLASMVRGGGAALLEAKEAKEYYEELLVLMQGQENTTLYQFYEGEAAEMQESIEQFELILLNAQRELHGTLYSDDSSSGLLNDQREFAEDLREELEEFDEGTFRDDLVGWLSNEDNRTNYALYVRDIESDIRSNRLFVNRAQELEGSQDFNYEAMDSIEEMRELVAGLDKEYLEHGIEITKLINDIIKQKGGAEELWPEDVEEGSQQDLDAKALRAEALADIKEAIATEFFDKSTNEDLRLRELVLGKLEDGLYRQHITGNANDPYLMTDAEYEWEVLRRERDRQAQRLERARRVKHYADIAEKHGAGLEMAAVTDWRVQASKTKTDLLQLAYDVTAGEAGDLALQLQGMDPDADPAAYESLFEQLIQEQTDFELYAARGENLQASSDFISDVADLDSETVPDADDVNDMLSDLGALLSEFTGEDASAHPLIPFRNRLQSFRDEILSGNTSATTLANRWKALHGTAQALSLEMEKLAGEFNYSEERELIRTALSQPNLKQRNDALGDLKDDLESTTETLRLAEERLNESREAYKQARIDLEIQKSGNAEELIQIELRNAASALGSVMSQMKSVEDAADIPLQSSPERSSQEYYETIGERNRVTHRQQQTQEALALVDALKNAMDAREALAAVEGDADVQTRAEAVLAIEESLTVSPSPAVAQALSSLQARLDLLEDIQEIIDDEDTEEADREYQKDRKAQERRKLQKSLEDLDALMVSTEESVRMALLHRLDRKPDDSEIPDASELEERAEEIQEEMLGLSAQISFDLKQILESNQGNSYSVILADVEGRIATAEGAGDERNTFGLKVVRDWIIDNRDRIEAASESPDAQDPTPVAERWQALIDQANQLNDSSYYWMAFENSKPESSTDDWVNDFRTERTALLTALENVISADNEDLQDSFFSLSTEQRELLLGYSGVRAGNATYLRRDLEQIRSLIQRDLDQLDSSFERIFEREEAKSLTRSIQHAQKELQEAHPEYAETLNRLAILRSQLLEMEDEIDGAADATERANLEAKYSSDIAVLEDRIAELQDIVDAARPDVEARQEEIRRLSAYLQELKQGKGSSSQFVSRVRDFFTEDLRELQRDQQRRQIFESGNSSEPEETPVVEILGLALGVFIPNVRGEARKDGDAFLISDEFSSLGLTDIESIDDIADVLNESLPGPVLEALSTNLVDYAQDPQTAPLLSEEMQTAIMMLQGHLIEVAAAREIIDMRDSSVEEIKDRADRMKQNSAHLQEMLPAWKDFEDQIMEALQNGASPSAILAILDSQENFELLEEEARRNVDGDETTDVPEAIQQRLSLYEDAHELLRNYRTDQVLASALSSFQAQLQSELNPYSDFEAEKDPDYYLSSFQILDFDDAISVINSLSPSVDPDSDETLRKLLTAELPELASGSLSRSIIMEIMVNEPELTGDALKAALIQELNDAKSSLTSSLDEMMQAALTAQMLFSYLKGEDGKNEAWDGELASLTDTQKEKAFIIALQDFNSESSKDAFNPESYPEEFVNLLVVRGSELAEKRYQDFLDGQDLPGSVSEEERPGLNLSGIPVFFQKQILARDFHAFLDNASALTDFDAFSSLSGISNSEILGAYFESRKMEPRQTGLLNEILAVRQWNDMKAEADAMAGTDFPDNLLEADESEYSTDFQDYIFALRLNDFLADKTVTGSTIAEQKESFAVLFQQFLDDPAYSVNGKSLRERIASTDETAYLEDLGFEIQRQDLEANSLLPGSLYQRFLDGELNDPVPDEDNVLPDEFADILANHSDYLAMAQALTDSSQSDSGGEENFVEILALLETGGQGTLYDDPDLADRILADTGYENLSEPALSFVRSYINQDSAYQSVGGADLQTAIVETESAAITEDFFPTEGDLLIHQAFLEDHGADLNALSGAVSQALEGNPDFKDSPLFTYYLNQRGDLVRSLLDRASGANSDFYNGLSADEKADFEELKSLLEEDELLTEELQLRSDKVATSLNHSAMQNLAQSGTIPAMSSMALGYFSQRLSEADFALLKENRQALGRAMISAIFESGDEAALSGTLPAIFSSAAVTEGIQELVSQMGPQFKAGILDRASLWRTYLGDYAINNAKRSELKTLVEESRELQTRLQVDLFSGSADGADLMQERLEESGEGSAFILELMGGYLQTGNKDLESLARQADRDFRVATRLSEFADLRGPLTDSNGQQNLTLNRYVNHRTYIGSERAGQLNAYRQYLKGYNPSLFVDDEGKETDALDDVMSQVAAGEAISVDPDPDMDDPDPLKSFRQFTGSAYLEVEEIDTGYSTSEDLLNGDWENALLSDPENTNSESDILDGGADPDTEISAPVIRTVSSYNGREVTTLEDMREVYYANLANSYLESISGLHDVLRTVLEQANATQTRLDEQKDENVLEQAVAETLFGSPEDLENASYDEILEKVSAGEGDAVASLHENLSNRDSALVGEKAGLDQDVVTAQQAYEGTVSSREKSKKEFAQAGRRQESQNRAVRDYFNTVMVAVEQDYEQARADYELAEEQANTQRQEYFAAMQGYTDTMDQMSEIFELANASQQELDTRLTVQEYANTPYLYATSGGAADPEVDEEGNPVDESTISEDPWAQHAEDAAEAFEAALIAYNSIERQFKNAGYEILIQDNLDHFYRVAELRKQGHELFDEDLDEDELERLTELQDRKHYDFEDSELSQEDLDSLDGMTVEELQDLAAQDDGDSEDTWDLSNEAELILLTLRDLNERHGALIDARADYIFHTKRMVRLEKAATIVQSEIEKRQIAVQKKKEEFDRVFDDRFGAMETQEEEEARAVVYRRLADMWDTGRRDFGGEFMAWFYGTNQILDSVHQAYIGAALNPMVISFTPSQLAVSGAGVATWAGIQAEQKDAIETWMQARGADNMEYSSYAPVFFSFLASLGNRDRAILESQITKAIWIPVLYSSLATGFLAGGLAGGAQYRLARQKLLMADAKVVQATLLSLFTGLNTIESGKVSSVGEVRSAELEYEKAQAELDYLTKAPTKEELVDRITEFGAAEGYEFTEAEKQYIFDSMVGPPSDVEGGEPEDALNITDLATEVRCVDSMGIRYSCNPENVDGLHADNLSGETARVAQPDSQGTGDGSVQARQGIDDDAEEESAYDLGRVLKAMVAHGKELREQAKQRYIQEGQSAETTFALAERSSTMNELVEWASGDDILTEGIIEESIHSGREYAGYTAVYLDYLENAGQIQEAQLAQQVDLQQATWDARYEELQYKEALWESKMQTILNRGTDQWAAAENAFLTKWNDTKSAEEQAIADAEAKWEQRIADHYAEQAAWEEEMRLRLAEKTLDEDLGTAIDDLNAHIRTSRDALNADLPTIDREGALNEAKEKLARQSLNKDNLEGANKSIENFDTNVELQLKSRELGAGDIYDLMKGFQEDLKDHQDNMQVKAKVQILEEYRNLIDEFVKSIQRQNEAYEQQTRTAALSAGYIEHGEVFLKKGQGSTNIGVVDAIRHYDIVGEAESFKETSQIYASKEQFYALMEQTSMPQFEAILHVEKLKVYKWMESVSGTAQDPKTRGTTKDPEELGKFGTWIGRGPDGHHTWLLEQGAGKALTEDYGSGMVSLAAQGMTNGLGQMGAAHSRPGMPGTPGFYLQLSFWNNSVAERNAEYVQSAGGTIDPISGLANTFNPVAILATAATNVEVGSRVHGRDRGNLIGANIASPIAEAMKVAGPAITGALGWTGVGLVVGAAVTAIGHSIRVNPTTGEMGMGTSDQMAINTLFSMMSGPGPGASIGTQLASNAVKSIVQSSFEYDQSGDLKGFKVAQGREGSALMLRTAVNAGTTLFGGSEVGQSMGLGNGGVSGAVLNQAGTVFGEYAVRQIVGKEYSNYEAVTTPSTAILGRMFGQSLGQWAGEQLAGTEAIGNYMESELIERIAHQAQDTGNKHAAALIFQALGARRKEESWLISGLDSVGDAIGSALDPFQAALSGVGGWFANLGDRVSNLIVHGSVWTPSEKEALLNKMFNMYAISHEQPKGRFRRDVKRQPEMHTVRDPSSLEDEFLFDRYEVKKGDTLQSIAKEHGIVNWRLIQKYNKLEGEDIQAGDILQLPKKLPEGVYYSDPAADPAKIKSMITIEQLNILAKLGQVAGLGLEDHLKSLIVPLQEYIIGESTKIANEVAASGKYGKNARLLAEKAKFANGINKVIPLIGNGLSAAAFLDRRVSIDQWSRGGPQEVMRPIVDQELRDINHALSYLKRGIDVQEAKLINNAYNSKAEKQAIEKQLQTYYQERDYLTNQKTNLTLALRLLNTDTQGPELRNEAARNLASYFEQANIRFGEDSGLVQERARLVAAEQLTGFLAINKIIAIESGKSSIDLAGSIPLPVTGPYMFILPIAAIGGLELYEYLESGNVKEITELYLESIRQRVEGTKQSMHTRRLMRMDARLRWSHISE
ncbi:MAG: hypothetical protein CMN77_13520 [Spirochaetaceae bacterium]|nr:hypothetical protein [Spirochaetaceae bacterium]|tara:strand:+ start:32235 stop:46817 length:14583 start_codon:yes stop_codon:yes gene_type:complete